MNKPKITFLVDTPNWAFDHVAKSIAKRLRDRFKFEIKYVHLKQKLEPNNTDLLYVFFWGEDWYKNFNFAKPQIIKEVASLRWKYEEQFGKLTPNEFAERYLTDCSFVTTPAVSIYNMLNGSIDNLYHCPNGVESNLFYLGKNSTETKELQIGWVGNPDDTCKGLKDILLPASTGFNFRYTDGKLNRHQLAKFYRDIDVLAIASIAESQPLPLLESMSSGCFPVTTNVGIVPEVIENGENGLIVERSIEAFRDAFTMCSKNLEYIRGRKSLNRLNAASRSWDVCADRFGELFNYALQTRNGTLYTKINPVNLINSEVYYDKKESLTPSTRLAIFLANEALRISDGWSRFYYGDRYREGIYSLVKKKFL